MRKSDNLHFLNLNVIASIVSCMCEFKKAAGVCMPYFGGLFVAPCGG